MDINKTKDLSFHIGKSSQNGSISKIRPQIVELLGTKTRQSLMILGCTSKVFIQSLKKSQQT